MLADIAKRASHLHEPALKFRAIQAELAGGLIMRHGLGFAASEIEGAGRGKLNTGIAGMSFDKGGEVGYGLILGAFALEGFTLRDPFAEIIGHGLLATFTGPEILSSVRGGPDHSVVRRDDGIIKPVQTPRLSTAAVFFCVSD